MTTLRIQWLALTVCAAVLYSVLWAGNQSATQQTAEVVLSPGQAVELKVFSLRARPLELSLAFAATGHGRDTELGAPAFVLKEPDASNKTKTLYQPNPGLPVQAVVSLNGGTPIARTTLGAGDASLGWKTRQLWAAPINGLDTWMYPPCPDSSCLSLAAGTNVVRLTVIKVPDVLLNETVRLTSSAPMNAERYLPSYEAVWLAYVLALIAQAPMLIWLLYLARKTWTASCVRASQELR